MNQNERLASNLKPQGLLQQCKNDKIPNATIVHGENALLNFNQMIIMASLINNQPLTIDNTPSDSTQEPNEDIIILNTIKSIKIDHVKSIQHRIKYGPSNQAYCIVIIHKIDQLSHNAKNALLKSIEEPPKKTIFIFSTTNKLAIPQTIKSRAQLFHIPETINEKLITQKNNITEISKKIEYISPTEFIKKSHMERIIYIQKLPYDTTTVSELLTIWQTELYSSWSHLKKEEHIFFQKIIEIISNIKYNFNLKLQLTSASLQIEEENRR